MFLEKFYDYNERFIVQYLIKNLDKEIVVVTRPIPTTLFGNTDINTYRLNPTTQISLIKNIPNIKNCNLIGINNEKNKELWRDTINKNKAERKYNLVTLYNPNPLPYKVFKDIRQLQVE